MLAWPANSEMVMCDCKTKYEEEIVKSAKEQLPDSTDHTAELQGYVLGIQKGTNDIVQRQAMQVVIKYTAHRKGVSRPKKLVQIVMASFCMFCGASLK